MSRHRFRSQPALQRSGGHGPPAIIGLGLLAAAGLAGGALIGNLVHTPGVAPDAAWGVGPTDQPAAVAAAEPKPVPAVPPAAPPAVAVAAAPAPQAAPAELVRAKAAAPARRPRLAKPVRVATAEPAKAPADPAQQQADYARARAAYDADERMAGFRWAQQNNIRIRSYCRIAAQRTPAFVEGCMNYLRPKHGQSADRPPEPDVRAAEQG
jgi:hypothetical protein